jgi:hypothetical protein
MFDSLKVVNLFVFIFLLPDETQLLSLSDSVISVFEYSKATWTLSLIFLSDHIEKQQQQQQKCLDTL